MSGWVDLFLARVWWAYGLPFWTESWWTNDHAY